MRGFFTQNLGWKLLSLAAALLLWISVASEPELSAFISVRVEYKGLAPDLEISSDVVETVFLEVHGPSADLPGLPELRRQYAVILDMSNVGPGQHTFTINPGDVRMPRGIQLVRAIPSQIRMDLEPSALRSVPVEVHIAGGLPPDLAVVEALAEPSALAITGPASHVARVAAVVTDPIELKPQVGTNEYRVSAFVSDRHVRFQDSPMVTVKVTVRRN